MPKKRYLGVFQLLSEYAQDIARTYPVTSGVAMTKGHAVIVTAGYAAIATTLSTHTFAGINCSGDTTAAEASSDGAVNVQTILPLPHLRWRVPVGATDLITLAQVGLSYDLQAAYDINENDAATNYYGFYVDEIDVSTDAIAISTFGFAIGRFVSTATS